ncbi:periplasmic heavy metal sensor [Brevundimonas variabilis]|uniref:Putative membrane protein n=1 Tax=Brevundimonas variabilis TaxID=74312 RepID=A0A7W9FCP9_9CAUL|nr:periplasmic heavy metal sensor [Brevundimonas variabilis]MBB5744641.1 putative membrane protein [Brevundimonas variabilis]
MNARVLAIALAVSVAVNLFAVAAGVTVMVGQAKVERQLEQAQRPGRDRSMREVLATVDPEVRDRVRAAMRASAQAARPDFEDARQARREAVALSQAEAFEPAAVATLLQRSREAELRGRARLETDMVAVLQTLAPEDRKTLSVLMNRRRNRDRRPTEPVAEPRPQPPVAGEKG